MLTTIAYYVVLLATVVYLAVYGGRTGLWGGGLQISTSLLSLVAVLAFGGTPLVIPMLQIVDFLSLGWKSALVLFSNRRWPVWVAAFQLNVVGAHLSIWLVPDWEGHLYYAMITVWGIPTLLVMILGTALDYRRRAKTGTITV